MAYEGSGDFRRGSDREEERRRGSGTGGREGYSESGRGEYGRGYEEPAQQGGLYGQGQGRRAEEPWRPGQAGSSEWGSQYGGGIGQYGGYGSQYGQGSYAGQQRGPEYGEYGSEPYGGSEYGRGTQYGRYGSRSYGRSYGYHGYGSPDWPGQGWGYSGTRPMGPQSSNYGLRTEEFGAGPQGYAGGYGFGYGSTGPSGNVALTSRGRFSGKGPKGYSRSDERIKEDVSDRLEQHGDIDATDIEVRVGNGEVTLEGTVEDRWTKRLAEDVVEDCAGVKQVHNRLRIEWRGEQGGSESRYGQSGRTSFGRSSGSTEGSMSGTERSKAGSTSKSSTRT